MYPLIEIKTVPIELQMKIKDASLEYTRGTAEMEISRSDKGDLDIKSRPIHVRMDSFESRRSFQSTMGHTVSQSSQAAQQLAQTSPKAVTQAQMVNAASYQQATATYAPQSGQLLLNARLAQPSVSAVTQSTGGYSTTSSHSSSANEIDIAPQTAMNVEWENGAMEIRYKMDKLNFDWKISSGEFKFTPGDIEISVEQQPNVVIKYTGDPIYVPPSADPNYEPVDVQV